MTSAATEKGLLGTEGLDGVEEDGDGVGVVDGSEADGLVCGHAGEAGAGDGQSFVSLFEEGAEGFSGGFGGGVFSHI